MQIMTFSTGTVMHAPHVDSALCGAGDRHGERTEGTVTCKRCPELLEQGAQPVAVAVMGYSPR